MGNLLKVLQCKDEVLQDSFLDFENAQPSDEERSAFDKVALTLSHAPSILTELQSYKGAGDVIRKAISNPSQPETQAEAWKVIIPLVQRLKDFYEFSKDLQRCEKELLAALTCEPMSPLQHLESKQALAKQFAEILHFTLKFDDLKMNNPAIQNDLSYFRRTMSRKGKNMPVGVDYELGKSITTEMANEMSLFYADHTPMLKALTEGAISFVEEKKSSSEASDRTDEVLSTMAQICKVMLENPDDSRFQMGLDSISFCVGVMVGLIILYDHVHKEGAFAKGSKIDVKGCIKVLNDQSGKIQTLKSLTNAIRFTTKHFNDETTPKTLHKMLE